MKGVEKVIYEHKTIAIIFRRFIVVKKLNFFTDVQNAFQIGIHDRDEGVKLDPHIHRISKSRKIDVIQELLYLVSGKIRITLYTPEGKVIKKKVLIARDSILLILYGHGVEFLQPSRIFMVKQGPYPGTTHAKIYLPNSPL